MSMIKMVLLVDGGWGQWTTWADCSSNCNGNTVRTRQCDSPSPANGGADCVGRRHQRQNCNTNSAYCEGMALR